MPWCHGFPFNTGLRHPQYLGVVLTLYGALPLLMSKELLQLGLPQLVGRGEGGRSREYGWLC